MTTKNQSPDKAHVKGEPARLVGDVGRRLTVFNCQGTPTSHHHLPAAGPASGVASGTLSPPTMGCSSPRALHQETVGGVILLGAAMVAVA